MKPCPGLLLEGALSRPGVSAVESGHSFSRAKAARPRRRRHGGPTGRMKLPAILPSASSMTDMISLPLANTTS
jgi:hypothetical protein